MIDPDSIPDTLQATGQWVCWRTEYRDTRDKPTKTPIKPGTQTYASVTDSSTWAGFDAAYQHYRNHDAIDGIGYVFTTDDPYVGVDLDNCRSPETGKLADWAREIIRELDSYTETSPSGTGVTSSLVERCRTAATATATSNSTVRTDTSL